MKQDEKIESILEAATKRFTHFGVDKTTMNEIADDLGISKASLYYYFPDKLNLYAAVLKNIIGSANDNDIPYWEEKDLLKGVYKYLDARKAFVVKYYRILAYLSQIHNTIPEELRELFETAKSRDLKVITTFLKKGKDEGILTISNLKRTAELFHACNMGLRISLLQNKIQFLPDMSQFDELLSKEKELADIFFRALKTK